MFQKGSTASDIVKFFILVIILVIALIFAFVTTAETLDIKQKQYPKTIIKAAPFIENQNYTEPEKSEKEAKNLIKHVNEIRKNFLKPEIEFDKRVFALAYARARDMNENTYFAHTSPEGECADSMKQEYELNSYEYVAENIYFGNTEDITKVIDSWMQSEWHRFNLLYEGHTSGAIACHENVCVFLGLNKDGYGKGCYNA